MPRHPCAGHPPTHSGPQAVKLTVCGAGAKDSRCTRLEDSAVNPAWETLPRETWIQAPKGSLMALLSRPQFPHLQHHGLATVTSVSPSTAAAHGLQGAGSQADLLAGRGSEFLMLPHAPAPQTTL